MESYLYSASITLLTVSLWMPLTLTTRLSLSRKNVILDWLRSPHHMKTMEILKWMAPAIQPVSLYLLDLTSSSSAQDDSWKHSRGAGKRSPAVRPLWVISGPISTWSKDVKMFTILGRQSRSGLLHPGCYALLSVWQPSTVSCRLTS
jgi:hypothetical protein